MVEFTFEEAIQPSNPVNIGGKTFTFEEVAPREVGFTDRVKEDYQSRIKKGENIANEYVVGNQSYPESLYQFGAQGALFGGDVFGEALKSLGNSVSNIIPEFIKDPIKRGVSGGVNYVMDSPVGRAAAQGTNSALQKYSELAQKYPRAARNVEATAGLGLSFAPFVRVGGKSAASALESVAKEGVEQGARTLNKIGNQALVIGDKLNSRKVYPTPNEIKTTSSALFEKGRKLGATFDPKVIEDVISVGDNLLPKGEVAKSLIKSDEADDFIKSLKDVGYKNLTLDDFESIDRHLGERAHATFLNEPSLSRKYSELQGALRESIENPLNIIGTDEGIKAQREAVRLWSIGSKMNDIERVIKDAKYYEKPDTAIKTGFRRIARNDKLMRGYTATERKAIERAATTGSLEGITKTFGSRLTAIIGGSTGGLSGAMLGYGISETGRGLTEAMKKGQAGSALKMLGKRSGLVRNERKITWDQLDKLAKELD